MATAGGYVTRKTVLIGRLVRDLALASVTLGYYQPGRRSTTTPEESEELIRRYRIQYEAQQRTRAAFATLGALVVFAAGGLVFLYGLVRFVKWAWTD